MKTINHHRIPLVLLLFIGLVILSCTDEPVSCREKLEFNNHWKFVLDDSVDYRLTTFNDAQWRVLNLPHDWSIEGEFSKDNPAGTGGGALPGGIGWYRKSFTLPQSDSSKRIYITFDGVYQNSEVFINGNLLGKRPNGYISFQYDLTPYINYGENENILAVRVDNSDQPNSRWYSGSGIYRNVWLEKTNPVHIDLWGTHITTPIVSEDKAEVEIAIVIKNTTSSDENLTIETRIVDQNHKILVKELTDFSILNSESKEINQKLIVNTPTLWSIENPYLYKAISIVKSGDETVDVYETNFGIRYFSFESDKGFILNGKPVKILGVCMHHDLGALGTAINTRALERQLEILKGMGCNGIRTSHNPPAPELLDLCDKMGFIVEDETFDMWKKKKVENDYSLYFDKWYKTDLIDHLKRDRNHPCIFSWSIGNEILEQWDTSGTRMAKELYAIVRKYAPALPITSGLNDPKPGNYIIESNALDLIGFNYHIENFEAFHDSFPGNKFIATETVSALQTRGSYDMKSDSVRLWPVRWDIPLTTGNKDNTCSAYDNCHAPWGSTHEETWKLIKKHDFLSGMYIWTGFDYIGEPTPYEWPSRSSYFGIVDLAGFPKDVYYMYQSEWTDKDVLHILPHWNWKDGQTIDVWAYTNYNEVELFINEKSQGVKKKEGEDIHLMWRVKYEPGVLKAIGRNDDGSTKEVEIKTAGEPAKIELIADRETIYADGKDLSFVTVNILDKDGNPVPYADNRIKFQISDNIEIAGVDNGCQTSLESFKADFRKAFNGKCLVILRSKNGRGTATLNAASDGLEQADITLTLK